MPIMKSLFLLQYKMLFSDIADLLKKGRKIISLFSFGNLTQHGCKRYMMFFSEANLCALWAQCQAKGGVGS